MAELNLSNLSSLISLLALIITYMIIQPLRQSIDSHSKSMDKLAEVIEVTKQEVNELRERVAVLESIAKSAHKRLDDLNRGG